MDVFSSVFLSLLVHVQRGATGLGIHEMQKELKHNQMLCLFLHKT